MSVGTSGAIFGVYGALLSYLMLQRGSVPNEIFREMRAGTLGFIGYSLFAGFSSPASTTPPTWAGCSVGW